MNSIYVISTFFFCFCSVLGNKKLCLSGTCIDKPKQKVPVTIVAPVASIAAIVIVMILLFVFKKKMSSSMKYLQQPLLIFSTIFTCKVRCCDIIYFNYMYLHLFYTQEINLNRGSRQKRKGLLIQRLLK